MSSSQDNPGGNNARVQNERAHKDRNVEGNQNDHRTRITKMKRRGFDKGWEGESKEQNVMAPHQTNRIRGQNDHAAKTERNRQDNRLNFTTNASFLPLVC
jgi:hypothetical protein